ncbi:MAG: glycine betaine ABC transporter substrate-binding protein [Cyanobacteria bacterium P01_D01_bin.50]
MKKFLTLLVICLCLGIAGCNVTSASGSGDIVIASKGYTEQDILRELLAQQIEATSNLKVERKELNGSLICHKAIVNGDIDAYVEYTGTALTAILEQKIINDPNIVYNLVKLAYSKQFNLELMEPLGFENTYVMVIRGEDAKKYNIKTMSEVAKFTPQWTIAFNYEFGEREDGFPGLSQTYNLQFKRSPKTMDSGLLYRALTQKIVDMVSGNSTHGQIVTLGLAALEDDKKYFPPYEAVPVIRKETLKKYPQLKKPLSQLADILNVDEMQQLNYQVEGELRDIKEVVREFRKKKGLT